MKNIRDLVTRQQQSLQTQNGQTVTSSVSKRTKKTSSSQPVINKELKDSVAYLMMVLRDAYPSQFNRAFPSESARDRARGLWVEVLKFVRPVRIRKVALKAIRNHKFMPSLGEIVSMCEPGFQELGLKEPLQAYHEACNMCDPAPDRPWSHPAVYYAGKATGWFLLRSESQAQILPLFEHNYRILCRRIQDGEPLELEITGSLEDLTRSSDRTGRYEQQLQQEQKAVMEQQGIDPSSGRSAFDKVIKDWV